MQGKKSGHFCSACLEQARIAGAYANPRQSWQRLLLLACCLLGWLAAQPAVSAEESAGADSPAAGASGTEDFCRTVPVLCYHRFGAYTDQDPYSVTREEFTRQLEILHEEGFSPITTETLLAGWEEKAPLPSKAVVITVDDGYKDFRKQAEPLLRQREFPAVLFIYTDFIGARLGLTRADLQELQSAGYEIGSHSASHPKLPKITSSRNPQEREEILRRELSGSRKKLQEWSGGKVIALAYPYGLWDAEAATSAQQAGYQLMFTVDPGTNTRETPRHGLKRNMILRGMREQTFRRLLYEKELPVISWQPEPGSHVPGPLRRVEVTLAAGFADELDAGSIRAQKGSTWLPVAFAPETGTIVMAFSQPWRSGTEQIVLTGRAKKDRVLYKQSWQLHVEAGQPRKE
ncbi:polysaccharide deacetylase family protein [candidate division FCPU426 bacterium]|nr:polysaccharide deacetylase family protein [candidate division FCPU426 bacterium]